MSECLQDLAATYSKHVVDYAIRAVVRRMFRKHCGNSYQLSGVARACQLLFKQTIDFQNVFGQFTHPTTLEALHHSLICQAAAQDHFVSQSLRDFQGDIDAEGNKLSHIIVAETKEYLALHAPLPLASSRTPDPEVLIYDRKSAAERSTAAIFGDFDDPSGDTCLLVLAMLNTPTSRSSGTLS